MKFHGLAMIAFLAVTSTGVAQNPVSTPKSTMAPANRLPMTESAEAVPRPLPMTDPDPASTIESELQQFRSELREFQELREEVSRSTRETGIDSDRVSLQQRKDLLELLTRLAKNGIGRKAQAARTAPPTETRSSPMSEVVATPVMEPAVPEMMDSMSEKPAEAAIEMDDNVADPFALGKVLFRSGDFVNAERAFRKVEVTNENEPTLNYLIATCLRRQSKWKSATEIYKSVAESDQDPVLKDLAKWQIDNIRWHRDSESQLEQMRIEREKRVGKPKPPQAKSASVNKTRL